MAHFLPGITPLYFTPDGSVTTDPQRESKAIGTPIYPRTYLYDGEVRAGELAYLVADDHASSKPSAGTRVYVESTLIYHYDNKTERKAAVLPIESLDFTRSNEDIHTIACDDAPKECDPTRWRAVVNTVFADCSETTPHSAVYRRRHPIERDIAGDLATIAPVVAAYAVARFVWGYDIAAATADALARCKREDDPALTRYLVAYERA